MTKISPNKFEKGICIIYKNEPYRIVALKFYNPGRGHAYYQTKLRNVKSGNVLDHTFKPGDVVEEIAISTRDMQYLYKKGDEHIFMDKERFDQIPLDKATVGDFSFFLKEGLSYQIITQAGKPIGIQKPQQVDLVVSEAESAVKGNTAMGAKKKVKLETGLVIDVPLFIKKGDAVSVSVDSQEYVERVKK